MMVASGIVNSGVLWANGATLTVQGAVSGTVLPRSMVSALSTEAVYNSQRGIWFGDWRYAQARGFVPLQWHDLGIRGSDVIDLANVAAANASTSAITRTPREPAERWQFRMEQTLELSLLGHYSADNFNIVADPMHGLPLPMRLHDLMTL
jgi:hypothetical protein